MDYFSRGRNILLVLLYSKTGGHIAHNFLKMISKLFSNIHVQINKNSFNFKAQFYLFYRYSDEIFEVFQYINHDVSK